jgi:hypothetical protein
MRVKRINNISPPEDSTVTVKMCGNVAEVKYNQHGNYKQRIKKVNKGEYVNLATGEVKKFKCSQNRLESKRTLKESLNRLRDYINTNVKSVNRCRWLTLTYKEIMKDPARLYADFKAFSRKCRKRYGHYEYIVACEYQRRGSLHLHCILIFEKSAPFMPRDEVAEMWGQGFIDVRKLKNVTDVGRYLTAYIGDMPLAEMGRLPMNKQAGRIKEVEVEEGGERVKKAVVKGARLALMPPGMNLYRISRRIKPPTVMYMSCKQAEDWLRGWEMTYQTTYKLTDEGRGFESVVSTMYYSKALGEKQKKIN